LRPSHLLPPVTIAILVFESTHKHQRKDLAEHGEHLSPCKCMMSKEVISGIFFMGRRESKTA
jgi:hypothetical protein